MSLAPFTAPTFSPARLYRLIHERGLSYTELGAAVERAGQSVRAYATGERTPSVRIVHRLAAALEVDFAELCEPSDPDAELFAALAHLDGERRKRALAVLTAN
ncbi:helix-turn-helix domain-containing protein [Streptomyces hesseae]|uniref:Helix-turn-helix transcriptional regulator n=1 Tax=Streptomyces hesseae TaxID=3075519 RepID=A0ABU2SLS0_9ACTN|nr:helix-turn-helix transcriptional regulator [Streptomyces sp. DSM 40473]MDT0449933.1 helix-turn-helix transcriptional regulator [Streptomyces sp. DSM 40473]